MITILENPFATKDAPKKKHFVLSNEKHTDKKFHALEVSFWWNFMEMHSDIKEINTDLVVRELCKHDVANFLHDEMFVRRTINVVERNEDFVNLRDALFRYITGRLSKNMLSSDSESSDSD